MWSYKTLFRFVLKTLEKYDINYFMLDTNYCVAATQVGPLHITVEPCENNLSYYIKMTFENSKRAAVFFDCDYESGVWFIQNAKLLQMKRLFDERMSTVVDLRKLT